MADLGTRRPASEAATAHGRAARRSAGVPVTGTLALLMSIALMAGGCGGDDGEATGAPRESATRQTTEAAPDETGPGQPQPDAPKGLIAYQTNRSGGEGIWLIGSDGTGDHEVSTDVPGDHLHPDWSPDGKRLLFTSRTDKDILFEADADGRRARRVLACPDPCIGDDEASYAPDASRMAFVRALGPIRGDLPTKCQLVVLDRPSRKLTVLETYPRCLNRAWAPRFSPDGETLVYHRDRGDEAGLSSSAAVFSIPVAGGDARQLTPWKLAAGDPDWSPDGERIVFSTHPLSLFQSGEVSNLYTIRPDGSDREQLTSYRDAAERASHPRFTPDGTRIVYVTDTGTARELWLLDADGSHRSQITSGGIYTHPVWQPNS